MPVLFGTLHKPARSTLMPVNMKRKQKMYAKQMTELRHVGDTFGGNRANTIISSLRRCVQGTRDGFQCSSKRTRLKALDPRCCGTLD